MQMYKSFLTSPLLHFWSRSFWFTAHDSDSWLRGSINHVSFFSFLSFYPFSFFHRSTLFIELAPRFHGAALATINPFTVELRDECGSCAPCESIPMFDRLIFLSCYKTRCYLGCNGCDNRVLIGYTEKDWSLFIWWDDEL